MSDGSGTIRHRIGIIAGSGPEAGIDMWRKVLEEHRALLGDRYRGDIDAPETVIVSLPELGYSMDLENEEDRVWIALRNAAERIAEQVDVYVIACNTLNYFADRLEALGLPAVLLTPAEAALTELRARGAASVALLGSRQTMDLGGWSSYARLSEHVAVELPEDQDRVHRLISEVKLAGGSTPEIEAEFARIRSRMHSDTVLLACTELPLLEGAAAQEESGAIDVSRLLARAAVRWHPSPPPERSVSGDATRPVAVLYTGGTFGMVPTEHGLAANPHLHAEVAGLVAGLDPGGPVVPWTYARSEPAIDSAEVSPATLGVLADRIRAVAAQDRARAVVVIHGTDSMAYSAAYVAFALADLEVPIVFTGAQRPFGTGGSDAPDNFAQAFGAASGRLATGVWIAFAGRILPAVRTTKRSSESLDAFIAHLGLAGSPSGVAPSMASALRGAVGRANPRIGLMKVSPGLSGRQLDAMLDDCPAGVVLECYGAGTAPMAAGELVGAVQRATARGSVVLAVTQCADGGVELGRYAVGSVLARAGALSAGDMTTEAALGKLGALARAGYVGDELRALLARNLIGEQHPAASAG
ncbi:asparaginase domain-containing protein [Microbacterium panaciterrae]|uniref:Aspartate racemase n=1 Tax=Microbacterium panaciterrae TaxID=985759 RepID=A0ABP8PAP3_9MICO